MIPKFLLNLSANRISLEQRSITGEWICLGAVEPDHPNLTGVMKKLQAVAQTDLVNPFKVIVALPTDQVKTLLLKKIDLTRADVMVALDGQTPYDIQDLCLDWMDTEAGSAIAAVARDTLNNVAGFAKQLNFTAVMFVALPGGNWNNNFAIFDLAEHPSNEVWLRLPAYISIPEQEKSQKLNPILAAKPQQKPTDMIMHLKKQAYSIQKPVVGLPPVKLTNRILDPTAEPGNSIQTYFSASQPFVGVAKPVQSRAVLITHVLNPSRATTAQNTEKLLIPSAEQLIPVSGKQNNIIQRVFWVLKRQKFNNKKVTQVKKKNKKLGMKVGGKPRYLGLFLTTLLLTFMLTFAAWAMTDGRDPNVHPHNLLPTILILSEPIIIAADKEHSTTLSKKLVSTQTVPTLSKIFNTTAKDPPKARPASLKLKIKKDLQPEFSQQRLAVFRPISRPFLPHDMPDVKSVTIKIAATGSVRPELRPNWIELSTLAPALVIDIISKVQDKTATRQHSVIKAATIKNILNLKNINLIGVSGAKSDPTALILLANGKVIKVKVGDRLNGGRVTNIKNATLTYEKSGRFLIIKMPRG